MVADDADLQRTSGAARDALTASRAFLAASVRSEVRRAYAVVGVAVLIVVLVLLRSARALHVQVLVAAATGIGVLVAVQLVVLAIARWAARHGRGIPTWFVV